MNSQFRIVCVTLLSVTVFLSCYKEIDNDIIGPPDGEDPILGNPLFSIHGRIIDKAGSPITVFPVILDGDEMKISVEPNAKGEFEFGSLPKGTYTITPTGTETYRYYPEKVSVKLTGYSVVTPDFIGTYIGTTVSHSSTG